MNTDATFDQHTGTYKNFIAGQWVLSEQATEVINPANGEVIARVSMASADDVNQGIAAARRVHESRILFEMPPHERSAMLHRIADQLEQLKLEGSKLLTLESGKRLMDAEGEFDEAVRYFRYYAGMADKIEGRSIPLGKDYIDYTVHVPYGVTAHIVPWNFPLSLAARSLAPALAAGNTAVVKVPELDPIATLLLGLACENAGVPEGSVSILCGRGSVAGEAMTCHPDTQQVVFTGSVPVGQRIQAAIAPRVIPSVMELGGKSAAVVCDDADLEKVVENVYWGTFYNAGQVCSALSRLVVPRQMQARIVELIQQKIDQLSIGNGLDNADITPVISAQQQTSILDLCAKGVAEGATLECGGEALNRTGYFIAPTVFSDVPPQSSIAQEEFFGPVLCVMPYDSHEEAVQIANGTDYGLVAGVFTKNLERVAWYSRHLEAGQVFVNEWYAGGIETPFGGMKMSGMGRDKGQEALYNYLQTKNIAIKLDHLL